MQKFVNDAISTTEIFHCAYRMMVKTAFETHFSRVDKNPFVDDMVLRVKEGEGTTTLFQQYRFFV
jgi:hypothetical protein